MIGLFFGSIILLHWGLKTPLASPVQPKLNTDGLPVSLYVSFVVAQMCLRQKYNEQNS